MTKPLSRMVDVRQGPLPALDPGGNFAVSAQESFLIFLVQVFHEVNKTRHDFFADAFHEVNTLAGDLDHDLAPVVLGVHALNITQFLQTVHQPRGGGGGMTHFLGDIRHREEILICQIAQEKELGEGDVPFIQLLGEVKEERPLSKHDEIRQATGVFPDGLFGVFSCIHGKIGDADLDCNGEISRMD